MKNQFYFLNVCTKLSFAAAKDCAPKIVQPQSVTLFLFIIYGGNNTDDGHSTKIVSERIAVVDLAVIYGEQYSHKSRPIFHCDPRFLHTQLYERNVSCNYRPPRAWLIVEIEARHTRFNPIRDWYLVCGMGNYYFQKLTDDG